VSKFERLKELTPAQKGPEKCGFRLSDLDTRIASSIQKALQMKGVNAFECG